jgi:hypothetical protein
MINEIGRIREQIEQNFADARLQPEEHLAEDSPCGQYRLDVDYYVTALSPSYSSISVAVVRRVDTGAVVATVRCNDTHVFHGWVTREGRDYFLCPEDLEGQTVVDLAGGRVEGFSSKDDEFIWAEFHPSPDASLIAIIGCYWACPYEVVVYDFRSPLTLPLPILARFTLPGNDATFKGWIAPDAFEIKAAEGAIHVFDGLHGPGMSSP